MTEARRFCLNLNPLPSTSFVVVCGVVELLVDGEGTLILDRREFTLSPGVAFAYGPRVSHAIRSHRQNRMRKYYLDLAGSETEVLLKAAGLGERSALNIGALHGVVEVSEALKLLENGLLVKGTAARFGFADAFQFSRAFKRVRGVTPTQVLEPRRESGNGA